MIASIHAPKPGINFSEMHAYIFCANRRERRGVVRKGLGQWWQK
ncbi:hypothetical protein PSP6_250078 [Paraburkholderia tropica]|nr:hypothetical protein PSP6_250078 [Paraburkholderia tropica]